MYFDIITYNMQTFQVFLKQNSEFIEKRGCLEKFEAKIIFTE